MSPREVKRMVAYQPGAAHVSMRRKKYGQKPLTPCCTHAKPCDTWHGVWEQLEKYMSDQPSRRGRVQGKVRVGAR